MAAHGPTPTSHLSTSHDRYSIASASDHVLGGGCNFKDLALGAGAPQCGCQRFWVDRSRLSHTPHGAYDEVGGQWCMCTHHICYHDLEQRRHPAATTHHVPAQTKSLSPSAASVKVTGKRARVKAIVEGASKPVYLQFVQQSPSPSIDSRAIHYNALESCSTDMRTTYPHHRTQATVLSSSPGCNSHIGFQPTSFSEDPHGHLHAPKAGPVSSVQSQASTSCLPPVPTQCLMDSQEAALLGSPPEVAGAVPTPSSGLIVSTSSRAYPNLGTGLGVQPSSFTSAGVIEDVMQSATEVATPSQVYTPDIGRPRGTDRFMGEWRHTLENHAGRIDRLENVSFSNGPIEDVADRLDLFDGRIIDLEGRLEEYDRWRMIVDDENDDRRHKQIDKTHNGHSFASMTSSIRSTSSSAMIAAAIDNNAMRARMATVESKVVDLESSIIASPNHPLELEVVLLPWGRGLKGIWYPNAEILSLQSKGKSASWNRTQDEEEWAPTTTGLGNQHTAQEVNEGGWNGAAIQQWANSDDSWMFPKACGVKSTVYKRLQSRGNVRKITLHEGSARNVRRAVLNAFGDVLTVLSGNDMPTASMPAHNTDAVVDKGLLGLRSQFIPLRKVHKDSRLRFLDPDEMVSSSLWTADFLAANVVMNAVGGQSRLFITHRDGYLQYHREPRAGWTWQRLRELPRVGEAKSVGVPEADAKETCWAWDPRLDPVSVHSSFASESEHQSSFVLRSSDKSRVPTASDESESLRQSPLSNQKAMPITPVSEFPLNSALECRRTASMPMSVSVSDSRGQETSHLLSSPKKSASTSKRRCISRSPTCDGSFPEWLWKATPRRSDAASSKSSGVPIIDGVSQITAASATKRESTPFAYATPHSGLVPMEQRGSGQDFPHSDRESGEDEVLPEQQDDDAWEGMEDYEGTGDVYVPTDDDGNDDDGYESDAYMEDHS